MLFIRGLNEKNDQSAYSSDTSLDARRRRITIELMAERAGVSRAMIGKIERGDPTTSIAGYASVLFVLGMIESLSNVVDSTRDFIGRRLEDEKLPQRIRMPRKKSGDTSGY